MDFEKLVFTQPLQEEEPTPDTNDLGGDLGGGSDVGSDAGNENQPQVSQDDLPIILQLKYFYSALNRVYIIARYLAQKDSDFYDEVSQIMNLKSYFTDFLQNWNSFDEDKRKKIFKLFRLSLQEIIKNIQNKISNL